MVVVVVEPGLADADDPGRARQRFQRRPVGLTHGRDVVWVNPNSGEPVGLGRGQRDRGARGLQTSAYSDAHERLDASRPRAGQNLRSIRLEILEIEMTMRVNHVLNVCYEASDGTLGAVADRVGENKQACCRNL